MSVQEAWWAGEFGSSYTQRNRVKWEDRRNFWELILEKTCAKSILEVGCNAGWNLEALRSIDPSLKLRGVDLNADALAEANARGFDVQQMSGRDVGSKWRHQFDLTFTAGMLIHVPPGVADLDTVMNSIMRASKRHVLAVEYAAPMEEAIDYRGHMDRLWRRPFGLYYEAMGLELIEEFDVAQGDGFDNCRAWLLRKPEAT